VSGEKECEWEWEWGVKMERAVGLPDPLQEGGRKE
jgi:hypothetical protein